ncbi:ribonuclease HI family protein [Variovorax boronicumulans]|uniref:ribonuclease HI family protein n=1 Tax=Variovorax boronicumulans TaxID=436515 RepID=UPI000FA80F70|nr:ribonuclease HI family protein [Variovorax boronicumulans]GER12298.1 ribonuclease H [Variovorax boronicumulans]
MTVAAPERLSPWVVHCDGSAMPNPGRMGVGVVITQPDGTRHTFSQATHTTGCNNEAELRALTLALRELQARGATTVQAFSDNSTLVEQLSGGADVRPIVRMAPLFDEARALLQGFDEARVQWIPRHRNGEADALARAALGFGPKPPPKAWKKRR